MKQQAKVAVPMTAIEIKKPLDRPTGGFAPSFPVEPAQSDVELA